MYIRAYVPSHRKIYGENDKSYTVFCIDVYVGNRKQVVEKRYSEFEDLHKRMKKIMRTPEFPPKKVLKWNPKVLEHRRQRLEYYLQGILNRGDMPKNMLKFLNITMTGSVESLDKLSTESGITHQNVLAFTEEFGLHEQKSDLPDIVLEGAIQALYGSAEDLS